ncbi:MAG: ASKHA domain-containing protein [Thermodesulfobacteriota bacterium]
MIDKAKFGVAFDIGSTTLAGALVDLETKKVLKTHSVGNPQALRAGADIISRIRAVSEDSSLLDALHSETFDALNGIIDELAPEGGISEISTAGNSVMEHILLKISPEPLGKVPYRPVFKDALTLNAHEAGLTHKAVTKEAALYVFPLIGGFVGGDTVAMMLSIALSGGFGSGKGGANELANELAIDIGTNSEIVLSTPGGIFAASAAAGPAFEAGEIGFGMAAGPGAISGASVTPDSITLEVIGAVKPVGICGSGLVDIVSGLIGAGIIDKTGRIKDPGEIDTLLATKVKAGESSEDGNLFSLYTGPEKTITLSQADVRSLQTAKGAIRAGVNVLIDKAGIVANDIERVYIAGAFGAGLSKEGLETIGLLDVCWHDKIQIIGNAVLDGAVMTLGSVEARSRAEELAKGVKYVSLSGSPGFETEFIRSMDF